jgi:LmbE family N-acetylglucosaminyl deacetylase
MNELGETVAFVFAHPDDETFSSACLIRRLADEGHRPVLLLATKGDAGHKNGYAVGRSREELAAIREKEMEKAAAIIGLAAVEHLGLPDGQLSTVDETRFLADVTDFLNRHRPRVVITFPPDGINGHPDHVAVSRAATEAAIGGRCPSVEKLYYVLSNTLIREGRRAAVTVDAESAWPMKAEALRAHESQILSIRRFFGNLDECPAHARHESFALRWERGTDWPAKTERSLLDGLR